MVRRLELKSSERRRQKKGHTQVQTRGRRRRIKRGTPHKAMSFEERVRGRWGFLEERGEN